MNEIQKSNAKIAIEYYQKLLSGEGFECPVYRDGKGGEVSHAIPHFLSADVQYYWPQEMVEHKGGRYPKPASFEGMKYGEQYYVPNLTGGSMFYHVAALPDSARFNLAKKRNLLHETKEAAIQHTKVMLGVSDEA